MRRGLMVKLFTCGALACSVEVGASSRAAEAPQEQEILAALASSEAVYGVRIKYVDQCPDAQSGIATVFQRIEYDVTETLRGNAGLQRRVGCYPKFGDCFQGESGSDWIVIARANRRGVYDCTDVIVDIHRQSPATRKLFDDLLRDCNLMNSAVWNQATNEVHEPHDVLTREGRVVDLRRGGRGVVLGPGFFGTFLGSPYEVSEIVVSPQETRVAFVATNGVHHNAFVGVMGAQCPPSELSDGEGVVTGEERVWPSGWPRSLTWISESKVAYLDGYPERPTEPYVFVRDVGKSETRVVKTGVSFATLGTDGGVLFGVTADGRRFEVLGR